MKPVQASIVIPTFNRASLLVRAIESSINQTVHCEIIVVDHGSTDNTPEIVRRFGDSVKYIRRENDFGPHFCWLEGVLHTSTELVHMQFDDDWIEPSFMESCLAHMDEETGFSFSVAKVIQQDSDNVTSLLFDDWMPQSGIYPRKALEKKILSLLISPGAAIYRKQILIDALYQGRLPFSVSHYHGVGPDCYVTLLSLLKYAKVGFVREPLASFQAHPQSITIAAGLDPAKNNEIKKAYKEVRRHYRELKLLRTIRQLKGFVKR